MLRNSKHVDGSRQELNAPAKEGSSLADNHQEGIELKNQSLSREPHPAQSSASISGTELEGGDKRNAGSLQMAQVNKATNG